MGTFIDRSSSSSTRVTTITLGLGILLLIVVPYLLYIGGRQHRSTTTTITHLAHMGNSFQFVNDLPRVIQAMGQGTVYQDSVLHGSLNFATLPLKGNGMYNKWQNDNAYNDTTQQYDFGACSMTQLLFGYDEQLYDFDTYYYDDGKNPCVQDANYLIWRDEQQQLLLKSSSLDRPQWDYVILNDQSVYPAVQNKRIRSVEALQTIYAPVLEEISAIPILIQTWAYDADTASTKADMSTLVDIPTFTSLLVEGYELYAETLSDALPSHLQPRIAPVGLAFLTVWEENYALWSSKFFAIDGYHPSPHGTYLEACVVYTTIFGRAPDPPTDTFTIESLFNQSRIRQLSGDERPLPTNDEALYLRWIAQRVTLKGHIPSSLQNAYRTNNG